MDTDVIVTITQTRNHPPLFNVALQSTPQSGNDPKDAGAKKGGEVKWHVPDGWDVQIVFLEDSPFKADEKKNLNSKHASSPSNRPSYKKINARLKNNSSAIGEFKYIVVLWNSADQYALFFPNRTGGQPSGDQPPFELKSIGPPFNKNSPPRLVVG